MDAYIKAISYYLPETVITNEQLVQEFPEWTVERIASKVGVSKRHVSGKQTISEMAINAAKNLFLENPSIKKEDIDFILLCTQSPDYILPPTSCIIQAELQLSNNCGAFDFNLGCSGYVYGLAIAKGLLKGGIAKNILLITSEGYTKHLHPKDKSNRTIFGDGATTTLISSDGFAKIGEFILGTDGSGAESLIVKTGGSKYPEKSNDLSYDDNGNPTSSDYLHMNGGEIFNFTLRCVPQMIDKALDINCLSRDEIDLYILHQANKFMLTHLRKSLKIESDKFFIDMENTGNTVSSTIPIVMAQAREQGILNGEVLIAGFGVGLSWGATVLECK